MESASLPGLEIAFQTSKAVAVPNHLRVWSSRVGVGYQEHLLGKVPGTPIGGYQEHLLRRVP